MTSAGFVGEGGRLRAGLAWTDVVLRSLLRDRTALFFLLVLPVAIIVIIGATFGGQTALPVGVVQLDSGPVADGVVAELEAADGLEVTTYDSADELEREVKRQVLVAGLVIPADLSQVVQDGDTATIGVLADPTSQDAFAVQLATQGVIAEVGAQLRAAELVTSDVGGTFDDNLAAAGAASAEAAVDVDTTDVGDSRVGTLSRFSLTAPQNLVLFVFINGMTSAVLLVKARRVGVLRRALATRTPLPVLLGGMAFGWYVFALLQSLLILVVGAIGFGVGWGDPLAATVLVLVYAAIGCAAGLAVAAVGQNEDRVSAITPIVGIVLGALGGCMIPLEVFPGPMLAVAHAVPQFWAIDAWQKLIFDGEGLGAIAPNLVALALMALALGGFAASLLRRELTRG